MSWRTGPMIRAQEHIDELTTRLERIHSLARFPHASGFDYIMALAEIERQSGPYRLRTIVVGRDRGAVEMEVRS